MSGNVDPVILQLEAKLGNYNSEVAGAANATERNLNRIQQSATQTERVVGMFGSSTKTAANDAAVGFNKLTSAAHGNSIAMRESLVVSRELIAGNLTRLPGSLSILAQQFAISGKSAGGFAAQILQAFGIVKKTVEAGAAAEAAAAEQAAQALRVVTQRAEANIVAADTEAALARAQIETAATATELTAAQTRLAAANEAMGSAAVEATIAQTALAEAEGRSAVAAEAAAAATTTSLGLIGAVLAVLLPIAGLLFGAFKRFQDQVKDSGELTRYRDSLGLTHAEMLKLSEGTDKVGGKIKELTDVTVTAGDVMAGLWQTITEGADKNAVSAWDKFKSGAASAFDFIIHAWLVVADGITASIYGTVNAAKVIWGSFAASVGDAFYSAENLAINAMNALVKGATSILNGFIHAVNNVPGVKIGDATAPQIAPVANPYAGANSQASAAAAAKAVRDGYTKAYADAKKSDADFWKQVGANAKKHAEARMSAEADALKADRTPKHHKQSDHGLAQSLADLDAQTKGQWALAAAYQVSDAAAIKATAHQKAEEEAIKHKGEVGVFYEKELALAMAQRAAEGAKTIADLHAQTAAQKQVNDLVAAGLLPAAQAGEALNTLMQKRGVLAAMTVAQEKGEIDTVKKLSAEINNLTQAEAEHNAEAARAQILSATAVNLQDIEKLKFEASLMGVSNRERAVAIAQLDAIQKLRGMPGLSAKDQTDFINSEVAKATAGIKSPLQQWMGEINLDAAAMKDTLEKAAVDGFGALTDGITEAITGTKSLGAAFHDIAGQIIADLVRIAVQQEIVGPLAHALFPDYAGGGSGGGGILSAIAGALGGGSGVKSGVGLFSPSNFAGRASGGPVDAGTPYMVGEQGRELFIPRTSGVIVPNQRLSPAAGQSNTVSVVRLELTEDLNGRIQSVSGPVAVQIVRAAQPMLTQAAVAETFRQGSRPKM
jgi:hypothetical protein